jgi:hypothetical protein
MRNLAVITVAYLTLLTAACSNQPPQSPASNAGSLETYPLGTIEPNQQDSILQEAEGFFGSGAQDLADVLNKAFNDYGPPDAYIKGEEVGAAIGVGLRYGHGDVFMSNGRYSKVYWSGVSLGVDFGGSASKVFILIYDLPNMDALFGRHGGVEGSLYFVGGVGLTYNQRGSVTLAPVRVGVGWRQGINIGYLHLSPDRSWFPF